MRVFITGGSGFIGRGVVRQLVARGHEVALLTRSAPVQPEPRVRIVSAALAETEKLRSFLHEWRPQACIHLAWYAEPGKYLTSDRNLEFLNGSLQLLDALAAAQCRRVVAAGTCAEYDFDVGTLREDSPTRPATLYAASKLSLCLVGEQLARLRGMQFAWARIFFPYGPEEDPRRAVAALINALLRNERFAATEGKQIRDYLHVDDIAAAFVTLLEADAEGCFNVCSGEPVTMRAMMETIADIIGKRELIDFGAVPYREWDPMFICGDNRRVSGIGWQPKYSLRNGLEATVAWWRDRMLTEANG
jgi:nucleoside-diphosphate-sugar epimerase